MMPGPAFSGPAGRFCSPETLGPAEALKKSSGSNQEGFFFVFDRLLGFVFVGIFR